MILSTLKSRLTLAFGLGFFSLHGITGLAQGQVTGDRRGGVAEVKSPSDQANEKKPTEDVVRTDYLELLKPIDMFAPPPRAKKVIGLVEVWQLVRTQGASLKVAREDLASVREAQQTFRREILPRVDLTAGHSQNLSISRFDLNNSDELVDRDGTNKSRSFDQQLGLAFSGSPVRGVTWSLQLPALTLRKNDPDTDSSVPERDWGGSATGSVGLALLRDNPFLVQPPVERKRELEWQAARLRFRSAMIKALADAEQNYYDLVQRRIRLEIQERSFQLTKALREDVRQLIAAGESSKLEAMRSDLSVTQAETDLLASQIDYEAAVEQFRMALALEGDEAEGVFPDPAALKAETVIPAVKPTVDVVRRNNTDIALARITLESAELDLEMARKSSLPELSLSSSVSNSSPAENFASASRGSVASNGDRSVSMGLTFRYVIFNDPSRDAVKQAAVAKQRAAFALTQIEQDINRQLTSLMKKIDIGARRLKIAELTRQMAEQKLASEYEKFKVGEASVRDVIDSQNEVNSARLAELSARLDQTLSATQLRTLMGRLPEKVTLRSSEQ